MVRSDSRGFPVLDLSGVVGTERCVVRCHDRDDARNFLSAMKDQYPEMSKHWAFPDGRIEVWEADHFDFFPEFGLSDGMLSWDNTDYADTEGYNIIDFEEIPLVAEVEDLGIFVPADELLDDLLT